MLANYGSMKLRFGAIGANEPNGRVLLLSNWVDARSLTGEHDYGFTCNYLISGAREQVQL